MDRLKPLKGIVQMNESHRCLDLRSVESDPEVGAAVFAVRPVGTLIANSGSIFEQRDVVDALNQPASEALLTRVVETIQKITHFLSGWYLSCEI
jgi:hypothetical protein